MASPGARLEAQFTRGGDDECWLWQGCMNPVTGYGKFRLNGRGTSAHRAAYLLLVGPVPADLCRNRRCVNPAHLEPVTTRENGVRGRAARMGATRPCGHPREMDEEFRSGDCPDCARARAAKRRAALKAGGVVETVIRCSDCGEVAPLCARDLCRKCYTRWYRRQRASASPAPV
jgi:hypothetical protein